MTDLLATVAAILITLAFGALLVYVAKREDDRKDRIMEAKAKKLKYWLNKCSEARELDK